MTNWAPVQELMPNEHLDLPIDLNLDELILIKFISKLDKKVFIKNPSYIWKAMIQEGNEVIVLRGMPTEEEMRRALKDAKDYVIVLSNYHYHNLGLNYSNCLIFGQNSQGIFPCATDSINYRNFILIFTK